MGPRTRSKLDRMVEERRRCSQDGDPYLVAALAAVLLEYHRRVRQGRGQDLPVEDRSNWRIVTRMAQLQQRS